MRQLHSFKHTLWLILALLVVGLSSCTPNTGIFAGGNWELSGLSGRYIHTLAVDVNNPQAVYAGDAQGEVFASSDGGQHWSAQDNGLPLPNAINALSFDATSKKLYAATSDGLFVSADGAQHWSNVDTHGLSTHGFVALAFDLNAQHTIYLASAHNVFVSLDDGKTWSVVAKGLPSSTSINSLAFASSSHQLWDATTTGIYRYTRGGMTWQALNNGLPANVQVYTVQPASASGGPSSFVYAGTNKGFFRSVDSGAHWAQSQESLARVAVHAVFVDFQQPSTIYAGTSLGVLQSSDSGQTWNGIAAGFPAGQPVYAIQLGASDYAQLFAATKGVYFYPGNSGGLNPSKVIPLLFILALFYALYRFTRGNQRRVRIPAPPAPKQPEEPAQQPPAPLQEKDSDIHLQEKNNEIHPE